MRTYLIREIHDWDMDLDGVTFCFVDDDLEPHPMSDHDSLESAIKAHPALNWHILSDEERLADEIAGDVLAFGTNQ